MCSFLLNLVTVDFWVVIKEPPKTLRYTVLHEIIKHNKTIPICPFKYYLSLLKGINKMLIIGMEIVVTFGGSHQMVTLHIIS